MIRFSGKKIPVPLCREMIRSARSRCLAVVFAIAQCAGVQLACAAVDSPQVIAAFGGNGVPITIGQFDDVGLLGYQAREYFISGRAHRFLVDAPLPGNGKWDAVRIETDRSRAFRTRVVVYTPQDPARFNGTVYVEWQNNSGLADAAPDWMHGHVEVTRQGAAYILASVQPIGIATLKAANPWWVPVDEVDFAVSDPERYASLDHPGNRYCYDIFSQIGQAVLDGNLLGGLSAQRVIGLGESQSASWLTTYINGVQALADVYDGFLVHSSFGGGTPLAAAPYGGGKITQIRDDLVPVLLFNSETDVQLGGNFTRQDETADGLFRLWEVAGTAHFDTYGLITGLDDTGDGQGEINSLASLRDPETQAQGGLMSCAMGINAGPMHWVFNAALSSINRWLAEGEAPAIAPRLETDDSFPFLLSFVTDDNGITLGGIRTPFVDSPLAVLGGFGNYAAEGANFISNFCGIFGHTVPMTGAQLQSLYSSNEDFADKFRLATQQAVAAGYLLAPDAANLVSAAERLDLGI